MRTAQSVLLAGQLAMAVCLTPARAADAAERRGDPGAAAASASGIIMPLDDDSMYVRGILGRTVVRWNEDTRVALTVNYRNVGNVTDAIRYRIHSSDEQVEFPLPKGPHYAIKRARYRPRELDEAEKEKWLSARGLEVYCGGKLEDHRPTKEAPYYAGRFTFARGRGKPAQLIVGGTAYEVSMKKGGQTNILVFGALTTAECRPFVNKATATGGKTADGSKWIASRETFFLPVRVLSKVFRGKFLDYLSRAYREGDLTFKGSSAPLADPDEFRRLKDRLYRKKWHVYVKPPIAGREAAFKYLARYTHRVAISDSRIVSVQGDGRTGRVIFTYRDPRDGDRMKLMTLDAHEFIRRFLLHVLPRRYVRIRHYGLLAPSNVNTKLEHARCLLGSAAAPDPENASDGKPDEKPDEKPRAPVCPVCGTPMILSPVIEPEPRSPRGRASCHPNRRA